MEYLKETLTYDQSRMELLFEGEGSGKTMHMKGIFVQGGVKNQNERTYPVEEISKAVESVMERINGGYSVLGEVDHPEELTVNLDRVSHMINEMWMDGPNGYGKLKVLPTPMGNIVKSMLESGVKLGVSSRGSGNVGGNGQVSEFEMVTADIVAQPSAPQAYPNTIYENLYRNPKKGNRIWELAEAVRHDPKAQKYFAKEMLGFIGNLKA